MVDGVGEINDSKVLLRLEIGGCAMVVTDTGLSESSAV
jgi:hypothetical protein